MQCGADQAVACRTFGVDINLLFFHRSSYPLAILCCGQTAHGPLPKRQNDHKYPALDLPVTPVTFYSGLCAYAFTRRFQNKARSAPDAQENLLKWSRSESSKNHHGRTCRAVQECPTGRSLSPAPAQNQKRGAANGDKSINIFLPLPGVRFRRNAIDLQREGDFSRTCRKAGSLGAC